LYSEEFHKYYSFKNIIRAIKSMRVKRAGHVARMGEGEICSLY